MNEIELIKSIRNFDRKADDQFRHILLEGMSILSLREKEVAELFGASQTNVKRWINGISAPHPSMRLLYVNTLKEKVICRIAEEKLREPEIQLSLQRGIEDAKAGRVISGEEFKKRLEGQ